MKHLKSIPATIMFVLMLVIFSGSGTASAQTESSTINKSVHIKNEAGNKKKGIGSDWSTKSNTTTYAPKRVIKIEEHFNFNTWTEEAMYFEDIRMDSLWYVGVGKPVPAHKASKMKRVYRMSMKLPNGKFIHVECLGHNVQKPSSKFQSLLLSDSNYDYFLTPNDSIWINSEKNITQVYQYPAPDNNKAIEIAYDSEGHVIHAASIEFVRNNRGIIVYYDPQGNMVNLTNSLIYLNGTIVLSDFPKNAPAIFTVTDKGGWPIIKKKQ